MSQNKIWNRFQGWVNKVIKPAVQQTVKYLNSSPVELLKKGEVKTEPVSSKENVSPEKEEGVQANSSCIIGLDKLNNLEDLTNQNLLALIAWQTGGAAIQANSLLGSSLFKEATTKGSFATEDVLNDIQWDIEPVFVPAVETVSTFTEPAFTEPAFEESSFLVGLENINNLENILSKDLLQLLSWEAEGQTVLPVAPDDLSLLDDLLESFPD